jgi:GNAT superfamily N-acetyltransferase
MIVFFYKSQHFIILPAKLDSMSQLTFVECKNVISSRKKLQVFKEETDLIPVRKLIHKTIEACYPACYEEEVTRYFLGCHDNKDISERARHGITMVYSVNERIVGTGTLKGNHIEALYVDPFMQGKGIGKRIMFSIFDEALRQAIPKLCLSATLLSKSFFQHLGFQQISENTHGADQLFPYTFYLMEKKLY